MNGRMLCVMVASRMSPPSSALIWNGFYSGLCSISEFQQGTGKCNFKQLQSRSKLIFGETVYSKCLINTFEEKFWQERKMRRTHHWGVSGGVHSLGCLLGCLSYGPQGTLCHLMLVITTSVMQYFPSVLFLINTAELRLADLHVFMRAWLWRWKSRHTGHLSVMEKLVLMNGKVNKRVQCNLFIPAC